MHTCLKLDAAVVGKRQILTGFGQHMEDVDRFQSARRSAAKAQRLNRCSRLGMRIRPRSHFTNQCVGPATAFKLLISMLPAAASVAFGLAKRRMNLSDGRPCARAV